MVNKDNLQFGVELEKILNIYTDDNFSKGDKEPLDSDGVESLLAILKPQLEYMNGNLTEAEYQLALDIRNKPEVQFFLLPVTTINDSNVSFMLLRVDENVRNRLIELRKTTFEKLELSSGSFSDDLLEHNSILIPSDLTGLDKANSYIHTRLRELYDEDICVDVTTEITTPEFDGLSENANWNENTMVFITSLGMYITNQFDTDFIDSFMIDYSEMNIEIE